jgi:proline iminopeptidase
VSERTIQRALRVTLGRGPKWVSRRIRLQEVARALASEATPDLAALTTELGYDISWCCTRTAMRHPLTTIPAAGTTTTARQRDDSAPRHDRDRSNEEAILTTTTPRALQSTTRIEPDDPPADPRKRRTGLRAAWHHPAAALAVTLAVGLGLGALMPRGPATPTTALATIAVTFLVGVVPGRGGRSRRSYLLVPAALAVGYELARISVSGPSVDLPSVTTMFGWLALIGGRGMLALVAGLPTVLGVAVGRHSSAELLRSPLSRGGRLVIVSALLVVALGVAFGRPARTAPIVGDDGEVLDDSIATLERVPVDGHDLGIMVRGQDVDNPVALFLAGGPGGTELGAMRRHLPMLEEHLTVVTWDQRGTGPSYGLLDPVETYTVESAVDDTIAVSEYLRDRFGQDRIHLIGQSWGTTLGVLAVQQRPDLYETYVGVGQMVSQTATDRMGYQDTLAWARDGGRDELVATLEANGPPPYEDVRHYEHALSHEPAVYDYDHSGNSEGAGVLRQPARRGVRTGGPGSGSGAGARRTARRHRAPSPPARRTRVTGTTLATRRDPARSASRRRAWRRCPGRPGERGPPSAGLPCAYLHRVTHTRPA